MTTHDKTAQDTSKVDELDLHELPDELDDDEEPPPTDPSPVVKTTGALRIDNPEDDLETRLAWLAAEVRSTSAQQAQKKRAESVLEAREYKTALVPASKESPKDVDMPKVSFAAGVDAQNEPTQITKRPSAHEWEFDTSEPEELSRTLPLDPNAAIPDPLPIDAPKAPKALSRNRGLIAILGIAGGMLLAMALQFLYWDEYAAMPYVHRGLVNATNVASDHYNEKRDGEMVRLLLPSTVMSEPSTSSPETISRPESPARSASQFPYVRPTSSAQNKPIPSSNRIVPSPAPPNSLRRIYGNTGGVQ